MTTRRVLTIVPAIVLVLAPLVVLFLFISRFAVNVPALDEWHLADDLSAVHAGQERLSHLWRQHNEHRMLFPRIALISLALISGWNTVVEMYASAVLLASVLVCWCLLYRETGTARLKPGTTRERAETHVVPGFSRAWEQGLWGFVPVAWLVLSPGQWENLLTGWQLQFCLGAAAMVWAMFLVGRPTMAAFGGAIACAMVASYSFNNGLVAWPAGMLALGLRRAPLGRFVRWTTAGIVASILYYIGYVPAANHPSPVEAAAHPFETIAFFVTNVGAPLGGGSLPLAAAMGVFILGLLTASAIRLWPRRDRLLPVSGATATLWGLLAVSLASSMAFAIGRVGFHHPEWAISSRYVTVTSLGIAALYLLYLERPEWTDLRSMLVALMLVGVSASVAWGVEAATDLRASRMKQKYAAQTFLRQPDGAFASSIDAALIRKHGVFLQGMGWSVFRDPVSFVLLASTDNGLPIGEILPDRPVVQEMTCPVSTLTDLQILFATYKRKVTAPVRVLLKDADRPILDRSFPGTAFEDNVWIPIPVSPPIADCAGRTLTLTISSPDAKPGNAVTVWTYPRYYKAALVSPAERVYAGRVIGIAVNASSRPH